MRKLTLVFTLIIFSNHLFSKMNDCIVNYPLTFLIDEEDCNGDFNGNAYLDDCLNCVGGNTGQQPCVPLNPDVELNFSNNQCGALSDIVLDVSQSPNQPDMENLIITTTNGQYDFSSLSIGDVVGEANITSAGGGTFQQQTTLRVFSIQQSSVSLESVIVNEFQDVTAGYISLTNFPNGGTSLFTQFSSPPNNLEDSNNTTAGNSIYIIEELFLLPNADSLYSAATVIAEVGDDFIKTYSVKIGDPYIVDVFICEGDSIQIQGTTFSIPGSYYDTLASVTTGCDSVIITNLNYYDSSDSSSNIVSCDEFFWDGIMYTESGIYTNTYSDINGCDSTHTLNLTINQTTYAIDHQLHCDEYTWIDGTNLHRNNTATFTLINSNGCDSVVTLDLIINNSDSTFSSISSCDEFLWDETLYNESGLYIHTYTNINGCDNIHTLNLSINQSTFNVATNKSIVMNTLGSMEKHTQKSNNTATHIINNVSGCDSIINLDLIIFNSSLSNIDTLLCEGDSIIIAGTTYFDEGQYTDTITQYCFL